MEGEVGELEDFNDEVDPMEDEEELCSVQPVAVVRI